MKKHFCYILLVDDDDITNFINENLLEEMHAAEQIHVVNNGDDALKLIYDCWLPDERIMSAEVCKLIMLDVHMAVMDGFELLEQLEKLPPIPNMWIVILSNSQHQRDREKAKVFKVKAYLEKPLTREKMQLLMEELKLKESGV